MRRLSIPILLLLLGCVTDPGYQSLYVGDGNLQWFIQPVFLQSRGDESVVVDFTYRRIKGQENLIRVNLTWNYKQVPPKSIAPEFLLEGSDPVTLSQVEILFHERARKAIRFSGLLKESEFLRLLKSPHCQLALDTGATVVTFASSPAFERVLQNVAVELQ